MGITPGQFAAEEKTKEKLQKRIGKNIKRERMFRKITQAQLGQRVGLSKRHIQYIEVGEKGISLWKLHQIASALGWATYQFLL